MTWTARNNGLTGTFLNVNHMIIHPATKNQSSQNHELFIATDGGVFHTTNGGRNWAQLTLPDPSNAEFGDSPAATVDELTFHWVSLNPRVLNTVYVLAAKDSVSRIWLYRSVDIGDTWTSRGITTV
jgi:hypothetical protein